eukprot:7687926-Alexandrium_andersonii.AAC.1
MEQMPAAAWPLGHRVARDHVVNANGAGVLDCLVKDARFQGVCSRGLHEGWQRRGRIIHISGRSQRVRGRVREAAEASGQELQEAHVEPVATRRARNDGLVH